VELHFGFPSGRTKLIDVDSSSHSGAFAVGGTAGSRPSSFTIKVLRERIDRSLGAAHHHICRGVELTTPIPAQQ
jgi:hypothetical protein